MLTVMKEMRTVKMFAEKTNVSRLSAPLTLTAKILKDLTINALR